MPFASRVSLSLVALSLSLISAGSSGRPSLAAASSQGSDEQTLRRMTEQYGSAIAAGDLDAIREFWNTQSRDLASRLRSYRDLFTETRIEIIAIEVTRLEITNDRAVTHLTTDERRLDKKTGAALFTHDPFRAACRSFEWIKAGATWKVDREIYVQDDLAARLDAAASERERDELLEQNRVFVTNALVFALGARGVRHQVRTDYDAAMRCFQLEGAVAEMIGDRSGIASSYMHTGMLKHAQDEPEQGLQLLRNALALYEAAGIQRGVALVLVRMPQIYRALGDYRQAFECSQKSLQLSEAEKHRRGTALALHELANIYGAQNNSEQALAHLEKAVAIAQELNDRVFVATLRHDVALEHKMLGNNNRALEIYRELLEQTERSGDKGGAAMVRNQIGQVLAAMGRYQEAFVYYRDALVGLEAAGLKRASVVVLNDLAALHQAQGEFAEALRLSDEAVSRSRQTGRQRDLWLSLTSLAFSQLGLNRLAKAREAFAEAVAIIEKLRGQTAGGVEESQRYFERGLRPYHGLLSLLVKENGILEALVFAERAKARVLLDLMRQGRVSVQKLMTGDEREHERRLKSELTRFNTQLTLATQSDNPDSIRIAAIEANLETARRNYEAFQNSLYAAHPELRVQRGEAPVINAKELGGLLPDDRTALLEYVVTDDKVYLFAITKLAGNAEADVRVYSLPITSIDLAKQIEAFRQQLASRDLGFRASAIKLYQLLLMPAQTQLRGKASLIIVPDNTIWDLPFQALLGAGNRFLIEDAAVAYTPSLTVLREMARRTPTKGADPGSVQLLALGNPWLGQKTSNPMAPSSRSEKLGPLPEAEQEVNALRRLYGQSHSKVYVGADAREDRVKSEAAKASVIHFATHGMLNNASPMYSHLALASGGANEDGLLEAWELMQLDLKADLAVLSACDTARGRIGAGEGMIGLSWAMFIAGVPSIVVSQWKVESAGTRDLMVNFHRALIVPGRGKARPTKTEALRQAALSLMKNPETRHPFYWAGFVLVGDGR